MSLPTHRPIMPAPDLADSDITLPTTQWPAWERLLYPQAVQLYTLLRSYALHAHLRQPSRPDLCQRLGLNWRAYERALQQLADNGFVTVHPRLQDGRIQVHEVPLRHQEFPSNAPRDHQEITKSSPSEPKEFSAHIYEAETPVLAGSLNVQTYKVLTKNEIPKDLSSYSSAQLSAPSARTAGGVAAGVDGTPIVEEPYDPGPPAAAPPATITSVGDPSAFDLARRIESQVQTAGLRPSARLEQVKKTRKRSQAKVQASLDTRVARAKLREVYSGLYVQKFGVPPACDWRANGAAFAKLLKDGRTLVQLMSALHVFFRTCSVTDYPFLKGGYNVPIFCRMLPTLDQHFDAAMRGWGQYFTENPPLLDHLYAQELAKNPGLREIVEDAPDLQLVLPLDEVA